MLNKSLTKRSINDTRRVSKPPLNKDKENFIIGEHVLSKLDIGSKLVLEFLMMRQDQMQL
jgi:hypothetical protein